MSKPYKLMPLKGCETRSSTFRVRDGQYALLSAYGLPCGVSIVINQVHEDKCNCIYEEKPFCIDGGPLSLDACCTTVAIPLPGCYLAEIVACKGVVWDDEELSLMLDIGKNLGNLKAATCCGET